MSLNYLLHLVNMANNNRLRYRRSDDLIDVDYEDLTEYDEDYGKD